MGGERSSVPQGFEKMAKDPIVFDIANSDPEITWSEAHEVRKNVIMATGR